MYEEKVFFKREIMKTGFNKKFTKRRLQILQKQNNIQENFIKSSHRYELINLIKNEKKEIKNEKESI